MSCHFISSDPRRFSKKGGREEQQDCCGFLSIDELQYACWVVADGLGGHSGGAIAGRLAVSNILHSFAKTPEVSGEALSLYIASAQQAILVQQERDRKFASMRTTVVALLLSPTVAIWGHIGDSRLYHLRHCRIVGVTKDHSVTQAMVDAGQITPKDIRSNVNRSRLLQSLGNREGVQPDITELREFGPRDSFLLCTDGFWEHVWEEEIEFELMKAKNPDRWLERLEKRLLYRAKGEFDNYSAVGVFARS